MLLFCTAPLPLHSLTWPDVAKSNVTLLRFFNTHLKHTQRRKKGGLTAALTKTPSILSDGRAKNLDCPGNIDGETLGQSCLKDKHSALSCPPPVGYSKQNKRSLSSKSRVFLGGVWHTWDCCFKTNNYTKPLPAWKLPQLIVLFILGKMDSNVPQELLISICLLLLLVIVFRNCILKPPSSVKWWHIYYY